MQNNIIKLLIFAIATAVIALIAMQYYWVQSSVELRKEEFGRNVSDALTSVSDYLMRREAVADIQAQERNQYLFIDDMVEEKINLAGGDTNYEYMMVERYVQEGNQIEVSITEDKDGIRISDSKELLDLELPKFGAKINLNDDSWTFGSAVGRPYRGISLNKELEMRMAHKNVYYGKIAKSLKKINTQTLEERIDSLFLDSLLHIALWEQGVKTNFEFGVFDHEGIFRFGNTFLPSLQLSESPYRVRLFKDDLFGKPGRLRVFFPKEKVFILQSTLFMLITSILVWMAIIYIFYWTVKAIITQKKDSEIKNDFINNMTHELKTPISTISLAVEVLNDPAMSGNKELLGRYLGMINEENKRLGMLVEEVLQSAALDRNAFKLKLEKVNLAQIVHEVVGKMGMKLRERKGEVTVEVDESGNFDFMGDRVHLTNVFYNLMDNAIKYSRSEPRIKIEVLNVVNTIAVKVSDNGVGIGAEHVNKVFDKLYRVPTGNLHDVKGFGLGLNYVKTIITRHKGSVDVNSVLGKGSTFIIYLPLDLK